MAHGFDYGMVIKSTLELILKKTIPLVICTDSNSLYTCLVKLGTTTEKRLMVDILCMRQAYDRRLVTEILWIEGNSNPADAMTKSKACGALKELIDTNRVTVRAQIENYLDERNDVHLPDASALIQILRSSFGEADKKGAAQRKLVSCKQGNRPMAKFLPEWQALAVSTQFGDEALIFSLKSAIHPAIQHRLALFPDLCSQWCDFIELVRKADVIEQRLDYNYYKQRVKNGGGGAGYGFMPAEQPAGDGDAMDLSKLNLSSITNIFSLKDKNKKNLSEDEKMAKKLFCIANKLCTSCCDEGHQAKHCPIAYWNRDKDFYKGSAKKSGEEKKKGEEGNA